MPHPRVTLDLFKEDFKFSAGHFTMFSATEREDLHGHNFSVVVRAESVVDGTGLCFDYGLLKREIRVLCRRLDEKLLLAGRSPWLRLTESDGGWEVEFDGERFRLLARDVLVLPVTNVTLEELSGWFLDELLAGAPPWAESITALEIGVASAPGQRCLRRWHR